MNGESGKARATTPSLPSKTELLEPYRMWPNPVHRDE